MAKYKIDWERIDEYREDDLKTMIDCLCNYLNAEQYPALDTALAIMGIRKEEEK